LPESRTIGWSNTRAGKAQGLTTIQLKLQAQELKWKGVPQGPDDDPTHEQLDVEVRGYQTPDDGVVQDSVMALLMACEAAIGGIRPPMGRVMGVVSV
jgi:hypothetical protein